MSVSPCGENFLWPTEEQLKVFDSGITGIELNILGTLCEYRPLQTLIWAAETVASEVFQAKIYVWAVAVESLRKNSNVLYDVEKNRVIIRIRYNVEEKTALHCLVLELANALSVGKIHSVYQRAIKGLLGKELFARELEEIEFESCGICDGVVEELQEQYGSPWKEAPLFQFKTLERYLQLQESTGHTENYRKDWEELVKETT